MPLTLEGIAKLAGVSRSTVSRVINDHPSVRAEVRGQVQQIIREMNYQPHAAARSLVTHRTHIISVIIPESVTKLFTDPFFPMLLYGITETSNAHHYDLMLSLFNGPGEEGETYRRIIGSGNLDGVIVASAHVTDAVFVRLLQDGIPFVVVGRYPDESVNCVDVDNVGGARMAVEHLIALGHTRIATLTGPLTMTHGADRLSGYRLAMAAHQLRVTDDLIFHGDYTERSGMIGAKQLLAASPTAIFVASDVMAIGALKTLREAGLRVPQDIALVGFDDVNLAAAVEPALTTVRQPIRRLGATATELLLDLLAYPPAAGTAAQRIILPTELIVRQSCGAAGVISGTSL